MQNQSSSYVCRNKLTKSITPNQHQQLIADLAEILYLHFSSAPKSEAFSLIDAAATTTTTVAKHNVKVGA